jgi:hypothetical protein
LEPWEAVREATQVIQQEAIVPDMRVCWLYNMLESGQLPHNWLADTYPAICQQCVDYGAEMVAASKERDRLSAEFLKQQQEVQVAGKRARATPEVESSGSTGAAPRSSSTASAAAVAALRAKRAR